MAITASSMLDNTICTAFFVFGSECIVHLELRDGNSRNEARSRMFRVYRVAAKSG
jgi:hypothetical protein